MRVIKNLKILWNDVSFNRSVKMLGAVMTAAMALFFVLWLLGIGINAEVYQGRGGRHAMSFLEFETPPPDVNALRFLERTQSHHDRPFYWDATSKSWVGQVSVNREYQ